MPHVRLSDFAQQPAFIRWLAGVMMRNEAVVLGFYLFVPRLFKVNFIRREKSEMQPVRPVFGEEPGWRFRGRRSLQRTRFVKSVACGLGRVIVQVEANVVVSRVS